MIFNNFQLYYQSTGFITVAVLGNLICAFTERSRLAKYNRGKLISTELHDFIFHILRSSTAKDSRRGLKFSVYFKNSIFFFLKYSQFVCVVFLHLGFYFRVSGFEQDNSYYMYAVMASAGMGLVAVVFGIIKYMGRTKEQQVCQTTS